MSACCTAGPEIHRSDIHYKPLTELYAFTTHLIEIFVSFSLLFCAVYVFLGDRHALIDFMRALDMKNLNNGDYLVIAVQDDPFEPTKQTKYFKTCECS